MMLISSSSILASQGMWVSLLYLAHPCLSLFSACFFSLLLFLLWYGFFFLLFSWCDLFPSMLVDWIAACVCGNKLVLCHHSSRVVMLLAPVIVMLLWQGAMWCGCLLSMLSISTPAFLDWICMWSRFRMDGINLSSLSELNRLSASWWHWWAEWMQEALLERKYSTGDD